MKIASFLFFVLFFLAAAGFARPADEIKAECNGRARFVWCQDAGEGTDAAGQENSLRLMGLDTDDGKGERCILADLSNYAKPLLSPDGKKIIFSSRPKKKIYIVGFDGSGLKELAPGFALAVWRNSLTETDWVYAGTVINNADSIINNVRRFRLDKPEVSELVWTKTPVNIDNFQLSADGRYACSIFPWPACGIAALPDREWRKFGDGCWPSLCPDNSLLLWIFDGAHRNLTIFKARTGERWVVNINSAPGIDGFEVYHPRWSNHPLFMVMTGPYKIGGGNNRIRGGGKDVEIYLGRFSGDFRKIERWIQVTHNEYADFFPDLWVAAAKKTAGPEALALPVENGLQEKKKASVDAWPVSYEKMVFFWQNRSRENSFTDPLTQNSYVCRAEAKGCARYGRHFEMAPSGGAFIADGGAGELVQKCAESGQLGIEVLVTPYEVVAEINSEPTPAKSHPSMGGDHKKKDNSLCSPPGRGTQSVGWDREQRRNNFLLPIIGYAAQNGSWNFMLGQKGDRLIFQLRSAKGGPDYMLGLGALFLDQPNHVIVSCSSASIAYYLNGKQIFSADSVYGGNWQAGTIVFGNEFLPDYAVEPDRTLSGWQGLIENIAVYSRWIGAEEARKKFKASMAHVAERKPAPVLRVKARLISMPAVPLPASIAPYRRALLAAHFHIEEVIEGKCPQREILAAQWVILDGRELKLEYDRDTLVPLALELYSDHPELEGERLIMDNDKFDLPLYYEKGNF